jgi:hypothetical protein
MTDYEVMQDDSDGETDHDTVSEIITTQVQSLSILTEDSEIIAELNDWLADDDVVLKDEHRIDALASNGQLKEIKWWFTFKSKAEDRHWKRGIFSDTYHEWYWGYKNTYDMLYTSEAVDMASANGHIDVLEYFFSIHRISPFKHTIKAVDLASKFNRIDVLNWWASKCRNWMRIGRTPCEIFSRTVAPMDQKGNRVIFKYSTEAITNACAAGHIDVVEWWHTNSIGTKLVFLYNKQCMTELIKTKNIAILKWWKSHHECNSNTYLFTKDSKKFHENIHIHASDTLVFHFDSDSINLVLASRDLELITFVFGLRFNYDYNHTYDPNLIDEISKEQLIPLLDVIKKNCGPKPMHKFLFTSNAINYASANNHESVLKWWFTKVAADTLKYTEFAMNEASANGHVNILKLWDKNRSRLVLEYSAVSTTEATRNGHLLVLQWWAKNRFFFPMRYDTSCVQIAFDSQNQIILYWWYHYRTLFDLEFTPEMIEQCKEMEIFVNEVLYTQVSDNDFECPICCDTDNLDALVQLKCTHKYHMKCIDEWVRKTPVCPYCKTDVDPFIHFLN